MGVLLMLASLPSVDAAKSALQRGKEADAPRVLTPRAVRVDVDHTGRMLLRKVLVACPAATRGGCSVTARAISSPRRRTRVRILPLAFLLPTGRTSRVRVRLAHGSVGGLKPGDRAVAAISLRVRSPEGRFARRSLVLLIHAPRHAHVRRVGQERLKNPLVVKHQSEQSQIGQPGGGKRLPAGDPNSPGSGLVIGIGDESPATFSDPLFEPLAVSTARLITPWNSIYAEPETLDAWLSAARKAQIQPLVAFEHSRGDACPDNPCRLPSAASYETAFRLFRERYPWVNLITPWNEANHPSQPTAANPRRAAAYYNIVRALCAACTVAAADVADAPGMTTWLAEYASGLTEAPAVWGLHNYYDTTYLRTTGTLSFLTSVRGEIWITETGGIVFRKTRRGTVVHPYDETRADVSTKFAFDLARSFPHRVRRIYVYQWRSPADASFDAGLIGHDGAPRPAYWTFRAEAGLKADGQHVASGDDPAPAATVRIRFRQLTLSRNGELRVPLTCPRGTAISCSGEVSAESAEYRRAVLVNARSPGYLLAPRRSRFAISSGRNGNVGFDLPKAVVRRVVRTHAASFVITLADKGFAPARTSRYLVDMRAR
jgi:hypothetical protein